MVLLYGSCVYNYKPTINYELQPQQAYIKGYDLTNSVISYQ